MLKGQKSENITETHQNEPQKAKITTQKASERVGIVLKGQKSENMTETHQNEQYFTVPHRLCRSPADSTRPYWTPGVSHIVTYCHTYVTICHIFLLHFVTFCHVL